MPTYEFFYWFFIFVGYFRAPALLILPFYIGKELYDFFNDLGSNVAFMAHAGGFVTGSILMAITHFINPKMLNEDYIEEDQSLPELQQDLALVFDDIAKYRFRSAMKHLDHVIEQYGVSFEWQLLRYHLLKMQKASSYKQAMIDLFTMNKMKQHELDRIEKIWKSNVDDQAHFDAEALYRFAWNMTNSTNIATAESLFDRLREHKHDNNAMAQLAKKLSFVFAKLNNDQKKLQYEKIAVKLL